MSFQLGRLLTELKKQEGPGLVRRRSLQVVFMMVVVMVIMKIENRKVIIGDHQAVAELADLRDGLIQLARTRLSFRQVQLISSIVIIS